jgi:amino-acid N-acetyltransferase
MALVIRKAKLNDVPGLFAMIDHYVAQRIMLARTLTDLYESVREFTVAEEDGQVTACGALKLFSPELGEIRSLCVAPGQQSRGVGRAIIDELLAEAVHFKLKTIFALTVAPDFFARCGFRETARERFPVKIWRDCLRCDRYFHCNETTVAIDLAARENSEAESRPEPAEVPA